MGFSSAWAAHCHHVVKFDMDEVDCQQEQPCRNDITVGNAMAVIEDNPRCPDGVWPAVDAAATAAFVMVDSLRLDQAALVKFPSLATLTTHQQPSL